MATTWSNANNAIHLGGLQDSKVPTEFHRVILSTVGMTCPKRHPRVITHGAANGPVPYLDAHALACGLAYGRSLGGDGRRHQRLGTDGPVKAKRRRPAAIALPTWPHSPQCRVQLTRRPRSSFSIGGEGHCASAINKGTSGGWGRLGTRPRVLLGRLSHRPTASSGRFL